MADKARARLRESQAEGEERADVPGGSGRNSPAVGGNKTEAEKRFEEMQRERVRTYTKFQWCCAVLMVEIACKEGG